MSKANWNRRTNKYGNRKVMHVIDGKPCVFDSKKEAERYSELRLLQRAGKIRKLERQVPFDLLPTQRGADGKILEYGVRYIADATYEERTENGWIRVVEDTKGRRTEGYILKRKLMLWLKGIRVREV